MRPWLSFKYGRAAWVQYTLPHKLTCISSWYQASLSAGTSCNIAWADTPALLISMSRLPHSRTVVSTKCLHCASSVTSVGMIKVRAPSALHSADTDCNAAVLRAASTSKACKP